VVSGYRGQPWSTGGGLHGSSRRSAAASIIPRHAVLSLRSTILIARARYPPALTCFIRTPVDCLRWRLLVTPLPLTGCLAPKFPSSAWCRLRTAGARSFRGPKGCSKGSGSFGDSAVEGGQVLWGVHQGGGMSENAAVEQGGPLSSLAVRLSQSHHPTMLLSRAWRNVDLKIVGL
jgi:hypothetical protein